MANKRAAERSNLGEQLAVLFYAVLLNHAQTGHLLLDPFQLERLVPGLHLQIPAAVPHLGNSLRKLGDVRGIP